MTEKQIDKPEGREIKNPPDVLERLTDSELDAMSQGLAPTPLGERLIVAAAEIRRSRVAEPAGNPPDVPLHDNLGYAQMAHAAVRSQMLIDKAGLLGWLERLIERERAAEPGGPIDVSEPASDAEDGPSASPTDCRE